MNGLCVDPNPTSLFLQCGFLFACFLSVPLIIEVSLLGIGTAVSSCGLYVAVCMPTPSPMEQHGVGLQGCGCPGTRAVMQWEQLCHHIPADELTIQTIHGLFQLQKAGDQEMLKFV